MRRCKTKNEKTDKKYLRILTWVFEIIRNLSPVPPVHRDTAWPTPFTMPYGPCHSINIFMILWFFRIIFHPLIQYLLYLLFLLYHAWFIPFIPCMIYEINNVFMYFETFCTQITDRKTWLYYHRLNPMRKTIVNNIKCGSYFFYFRHEKRGQMSTNQIQCPHFRGYLCYILSRRS